MKLSQEQTEGKLPEPGGCTLRGERAGEGTGHFWAIASCPRRGPPMPLEGQPALGWGDGNSAAPLPVTSLSVLSSLESKD